MSPAQKTHILDVLQKATREVDECKTLFNQHKSSCTNDKKPKRVVLVHDNIKMKKVNGHG